MKARRIVQRIEAQRWTYYVQSRVWGFFYRDAQGPFATKAAATEAQTTLRARDDYGGRLPWEQAKLQTFKTRYSGSLSDKQIKDIQQQWSQIAGARKPPAEAGILLTQEELT
jgi:hypothetical protein